MDEIFRENEDEEELEEENNNPFYNPWQTTALHIAAQNCSYKLVKLLLENGSEVLHKNGYNESLLSKGIKEGRHTKIAELLLQNGADVNERNTYGDTPLHIAAHHNNFDLVELLLEQGADPNIRNNEGNLAEAYRNKDINELFNEYR
jgi:ankyrin repeat protein